MGVHRLRAPGLGQHTGGCLFHIRKVGLGNSLGLLLGGLLCEQVAVFLQNGISHGQLQCLVLR